MFQMLSLVSACFALAGIFTGVVFICAYEASFNIICFTNSYTVILQCTNTLGINTNQKIFILQSFTEILYKYTLRWVLISFPHTKHWEYEHIFLSNMKAAREPQEHLSRNMLRANAGQNYTAKATAEKLHCSWKTQTTSVVRIRRSPTFREPIFG